MRGEILSRLLAEEIEYSEIQYMTDRMNAIKERPGNPMGVDMRMFGGAAAFRSTSMPWPQFNTVKGISENELPLLDEMIAFYKDNGCRPQFEVTPAKASAALFRSLAERGLMQTGFHASLYGRPEHAVEMGEAGGKRGDASTAAVRHSAAESLCGASAAVTGPLDDSPVAAGIAVRGLSADELELYAEIHCLGTGLPISGKGHVADNNVVLYGRPGWKFYLAAVDGEPAGVGVMYRSGGLASFTFAAVLPQFRNRGVHAALLHARALEAARHNCFWIVSQAAYVSASFRNMQRVGMLLGYTRATWTSGSERS
ncbi:GNAT family N-acetyltransferase [Paenibacillus thalictri]|uniref:N-acetyltransferase n=1 Tax=Paenibacillus thalictri TaxID=2527873 RepID=A0A4Q9DN29_9BACL|nr:GNAT family N-acetyltransferase [Paenibacillus thalictri]TBL75687.1 N-acetyltransferase [Paenibacillus thalictri]